MNKYDHLKKLYLEIERQISNGAIESAGKSLEAFAAITDGAVESSIRANLLTAQHKLEQAAVVLQKAIIRYPFHVDININLGIVYELSGKPLDATYYFARAKKVATTKEDIEFCEQSIQKNRNTYLEVHKQDQLNLQKYNEMLKTVDDLLNESDDRNFPLDRQNKSLIRKSIRENGQLFKFVNLYQPFNIIDIDENNRVFHKTEIYEGFRATDVTIGIPQEVIIPISIIDDLCQIKISDQQDQMHFAYDEIDANHFVMLRVPPTQKLQIQSAKPIFIGKPIPVRDQAVGPRLVLQIFVDGLSAAFLKKEGFEQLMPNTARMFSEGTVFMNGYATGDWTLPSQASICTGKYTSNHGLFHPRNRDDHFEDRNKFVGEYMQQAGYFSGRICSCWRMTPTYGFHKGHDRFVYKNFLGGMDSKEVVSEAIEHLETFRHKQNYLWLTLEDLHHVADQIDDKLFSQSELVWTKRKKNNSGQKSVFKSYHPEMIERYQIELHRVDVYLGVLFDYVQKHYGKDELLIVLQSDHGQTFLEESPHPNHESRRNVPILFYGRDIPARNADEIIENVDILPAMMHLLNKPIVEPIDGKVPFAFGGNKARTYSYSEVLYPGQPYRAALSDRTHTFYFESVLPVGHDGLVDFSKFTYEFINFASGNDEKELYTEICTERLEAIFAHMKRRFRF